MILLKLSSRIKIMNTILTLNFDPSYESFMFISINTD